MNNPVVMHNWPTMSVPVAWPMIVTDEVHDWSKRDNFESKASIPVTELNAELFEDALKVTDEWKTEVILKRYSIYNKLYTFTTVDETDMFAVYSRDGLTIKIEDDQLLFAGKYADWIDDTADLVSNEDLLLKFLDWIYEGGECPIMKPLIKRIQQKANAPTYPVSNDHLNRKNNRKK